VIAYKFLRAGGFGPFTDFEWRPPLDDRPGPWVAGDGPPMTCARGVHACELGDLPVWLGDELWVVELSGAMERARTKVVAERGRLLRRVDAWNDATRRELAEACLRRLEGHAGYREDAEAEWRTGNVAAVAYIAAHAAGHAEGSPAGIARERAWQAAWLERRLGL
jgi:hypothetical protein